MNRTLRSLACIVSASLVPFAARGLAQCSASLSDPRVHLTTAVAGDQLFVAGPGPGWNGGKVDHYDPSSGSWSVHDLSEPRSIFASVGVNDTALFAGGYLVGSWLVTDRVDLYDTLTGTWSTAALSQARAYLSSAKVGTMALFAGGYGVSDLPDYSARVDLYDTATGAWSSADLSQARSGMSITVAEDLVIFAGGWTAPSPGAASVPSDAVDIFDSATGLWSSATLTQPRAGSAATSIGSTALFAGGWSSNDPSWVQSDVVDIFDGASGLWTSATLSSSRTYHTATSIAGKAYFAGGMAPDLNNPGWTIPTAVIDVFDSLTSTWSVAWLSEPRYFIAAIPFGERAYFAGGSIGNHAGKTVVDVLDTATDSWSTQHLGEARGSMAAVALSDRLLFIGGDGACGFPDPGPDPCNSSFVDILPGGGSRPFCFGDGAGADCGCANPGTGPAGCANSSGAGATLTSTGCNSMNAEDLRLQAGAMPVGSLALLFVGDNALGGGAGVPFGDGLRCVGGGIARLGTRTVGTDGAAEWGPGLADSAGFGIGELRRFQAFYRDAASPCGSGFNASNGLEVELTP